MTAKRRAAKGDGSVFYDASIDRWVALVTVTGENGKPRRRKATARDEVTARRHRKAMLAERDKTGGSVSPGNYTVGQCLDDFLAHPLSEWKSDTTKRVNRDLARRLRASLGSTRLSKLTIGQVEDHLRREVLAGLAKRTVRSELAVLRKAIKRAMKHDLASRNVAMDADMPGGAGERESGAMTVKQVNRLLASDLGPFMRAWISTAVMCGLRPGEVGALSWSDVEGGVLRVRHSLHDRPGGRPSVGGTKTEHSRRSLELPAAVTEALAAWGAEQAEQQMLAGGAWERSDLIFTDGLGRPLNRQRINREFRAACKAAGVARPDGTAFQPRECRHTFVSVLSDKGVSIEVIADAVGHRNSRVTQLVYRHQLADVIQATATTMDGIFGSAK